MEQIKVYMGDGCIAGYMNRMSGGVVSGGRFVTAFYSIFNNLVY